MQKTSFEGKFTNLFEIWHLHWQKKHFGCYEALNRCWVEIKPFREPLPTRCSVCLSLEVSSVTYSFQTFNRRPPKPAKAILSASAVAATLVLPIK